MRLGEFDSAAFLRLSSLHDRLTYIKDTAPVSSYTGKMILIALGVDKRRINGLKILDVGGGASDLTAFAVKYGADARAIDPLYGRIDELKRRAAVSLLALPTHPVERREYATARDAFLASYAKDPDRYIEGSATDLSMFPGGMFDMVISSGLLTAYIDSDLDIYRLAMEESLRVLKVGGTLRVVPYNNVYKDMTLSGSKDVNKAIVEKEILEDGSVSKSIITTAKLDAAVFRKLK